MFSRLGYLRQPWDFGCTKCICLPCSGKGMPTAGTCSSSSITNTGSIQAQRSLFPSLIETIISQPSLGALLAWRAEEPSLQSFNLCKPRERVRALQLRTLQWNCWLYPFCDNHRHLSIKRNKFRHCGLYQLSVLPHSSGLLFQSCAVFMSFARAFYFWPNQHKVVVVVKIRLFFFFFLIFGFEPCFTLAGNKYRHSIVSLCN